MSGFTAKAGSHPGTYAIDSVKTTNDRETRWGVIWLDGATSSALWHSEMLNRVTDVEGGRISCEGGLKTAPPNRLETATHEKEAQGHGFSNVAPTVDIDVSVDGRHYELSFELPEIVGEVSGTSVWTNSGGCKDGSETVNIPKIPWPLSKSDRLVVKGSVSGKGDTISGSDTVDLIPFGVTIPGVDVMEHKIQIHWHLHNVP